MNAITELTKKLTDGKVTPFELYWRGLLQSPSSLIDACRSAFDVRDGHSIATCMTMFEDADSLQLLKGFYANRDWPFAQYTSELDIDSAFNPGGCSIRSRVLRLLRGTSLAIAVADEDFSEVQRCVASVLPNLRTTSEPQWDTSSDPARAVDVWLQNAACAQGVDLSLERDVLNQFCGGFRPARQAMKLPVLYYNGDVGYRCTLSCDAIVRGTGNVFPDPQLMTLVPLCGDFSRSVRDSWQLACRLFNSATPIEIDVRWSLDLSDLPRTNGMPLPVMGKSMGATLATVFWQLLAGEEVDNHWALTAAVDRHGKLSSVGGVEAKAKEWFQFDKHIRRLMVTEKDASDAKAGARAANVGEPDRHVHIVRTIQEVASTLTELERQRYGTTRRRPPLDVRFTGRSKIFNRVQSFIEDCESRYLVLSGGMGRGKTQLMSKLIHDAFGRGDRPVYHMISQNQPVTEVGQSLSQQLRRKYAHDLPNLRDDVRLAPLLEEINAWLVEHNRTEVLYIDAADQLAGESRRGGLLPGVLPADLPSQFRCVVTSRYDQQWYRQTRGVLFENLDAHTDDWQDVRTYLMCYGQELEPPLSQKLIDAIVSSTHCAPVFFTVRKCLEQCGDNELLRQDAELWLREPEDLIDEAVGKLEADAQAEGLKNSQVRETLGLIALAGEPLSEDQLDDLALWEPDVTDKVLELAASFFKPVHSSSQPIEFDHPGYERVVLAQDRLKKSQRKKVLTQLLDACRNWHDLDEARGYALRRLPGLLTEFEEWSELVELFRDLEYLEARIEPGGDAVTDLATDFRNAITALPKDQELVWQLRLLNEAIQRSTHLLAEDPRRLLSCLWNYCWWYDCEDSAKYFSFPESTLDTELPWNRANKLSSLLKAWRSACSYPDDCVLPENIRPPGIPLGTGVEHVLKFGGRDTGTIDSMAWNPSHPDLIAIKIGGYFMTVVNVSSESPLFDIGGHEEWIEMMTWSPDGSRLATCSADCTARVWGGRTGAEVSRMAGHSRKVVHIDWSPDGSRIVSASRDGQARVWDARTGELQLILEGHKKGLRSAWWNEAGDRIATESDDQTARVWNAATGTELFSFTHESSAKRGIAWSPDGVRLAGAGRDGSASVWNAETGELEFTLLEGHELTIVYLAWNRDGSMLATAGFDGAVIIWNATSGEQRFKFSDYCNGVKIAWSPSEDYLAIWNLRRIDTWSAVSGRQLAVFKGHESSVTDLSWSPNGRNLATGDGDCTVRIWDSMSHVRPLSRKQNSVRCISWSPDGSFIATGGFDETVEVWNAESGDLLVSLSGFEHTVDGLAWNSEGSQLAANSTKHVIAWRVATGEVVVHLERPELIYSIDWCPGKPILAIGTSGNAAEIYDVAEKRSLCEIEHESTVDFVRWSPDGQRLMTHQGGRQVCIYDVQTWSRLLAIDSSECRMWGMDWSPDGRRLAAGGSDGDVRIWDTVNGQQLLKLHHSASVASVKWSPNGTRLATGSWSRLVQVWDPTTGHSLHVFDGNTMNENTLSWNPAGTQIATPSHNTFQITRVQ
jgi:WD40 repeat protein